MVRQGCAAVAAVLLLLLAAAVASASEPAPGIAPAPDAQALPVEGFMTLTGRIEAGADRRVSGWAIDDAAKVPEDVRAFLARRIAGWSLDFDEGVAPPARPMRFTVRVRASPLGDGLYRLWLDGVHVDEPMPDAHRFGVEHGPRPVYPRGMARIGASGIVYMLVLAGADGRVEDVFAEQVDLTALPADPADFPRHQLEFMAQAAAAARQWRFRMPAEGPYAGRPQAVRIPFEFSMRDRRPAYGEWEYLVRGVRRMPPWSAVDPGAMGSAGVMPARSRMRVVGADEVVDGAP